MTPTRNSSNAGLLGLEHGIRTSTTDQLIEQYELIGDIHPALWDVAKSRFALVVAELQRRGWHRPIRLMTPAGLMEEYA